MIVIGIDILVGSAKSPKGYLRLEAQFKTAE